MTVHRVALILLAFVVILTGLPLHEGPVEHGPDRLGFSVAPYWHASNDAGQIGDQDQKHDHEHRASFRPVDALLASRRASGCRVDWSTSLFTVEHPGFGLDRPPRLASFA